MAIEGNEIFSGIELSQYDLSRTLHSGLRLTYNEFGLPFIFLCGENGLLIKEKQPYNETGTVCMCISTK